MEFVRDFKKINKNDVTFAGGKGASLGEMTRAGIPVPPGFIVLSGTFDKFIEETDLNVEIEAILHSVNHKEIHTVEHASEKIQALILAAKMPDDIAIEITKYFKKLDAQYVAVRSSATAEDSASAAWAGQLESYLNTTEEELLKNVQRCWASLFTPRAIFYRFEKDLHKHKISVAVVVQKMIESEVSGIAFSVHPVTQDYNQLIIEAGFGLGEAIVSGQITPDSYVVEKSPRRIIDKNISTQTRGLYRGGWQDIVEAKGKEQALTDAQILELSELILTIENHYGFPCDIEWAFEGSKFYIVQSRPITTLSEVSKVLNRKVILHKSYERDIDLILEMAWGRAFNEYLKERLNVLNPFPPMIVFYATGENVQIWEHEAAIQWFCDMLLARNNNDESFLPKVIDEYGAIYTKMESLWNIGATANKEVLKEYVNLLQSGIALFAFWYYIAFDERSPKKARQLALKVREHDEFFARNTVYIKDCIEKLGGRRELANLVFIDEFPNIPSNEVLECRAKGVVIIDGREVKEITIKEFAGKNSEYEFKDLFETYENLNEIKGQVAYRGCIKGKVKIVKNYRDMMLVGEQDILVSPMTTPDFLPAIKKAIAIVTDEGGITSHASIVAREMNKPCIIGTKIATQVLKDGDLVEVDADNGVVRIIKKHE